MLTFLPRLLRPSREGTLCLHPLEGVPGAFVSNASPVSRALLVFCVNQVISASFSLLLSFFFFLLFFFLIIDSVPPGSSPLKDPNKWRPNRDTGIRGTLGGVTQDLLRSVSTKTWVKQLESLIIFLLYFIIFLKFRDFWFHANE